MANIEHKEDFDNSEYNQVHSFTTRKMEQHGCLWDVFDKDSHNRDEQQKVYGELQGVLGMSIPEIKLKIAG